MFAASDYMITIVELHSFQGDVEKVLTEEEMDELAEFIAANPHFGDVIAGTGGVRKLKWNARKYGARANARVIYYFRDLNMPVFLLAIFAPGEKMPMTVKDRETMKDLVGQLVEEYGARWQNIVAIDKGPA